MMEGRKIRFMLTVAAADEVARMCPDDDLGKIKDVLNSGSFPQRTAAARKFILAMANGFDQGSRFVEPGAEPQNLTEADLMDIPVKDLWALLSAAINQFILDQGGTVEVAPEKKAGAPG